MRGLEGGRALSRQDTFMFSVDVCDMSVFVVVKQ